MLKHLRSDEFISMSFLTLNYHRPPLDACGLEDLDKEKFDIACTILDGVQVRLGGVSISLNYLSECDVKKL